ncbi:MAG: ATP-binding protein, partial [Gammaproteobacteria bacterium]
MDETMEQTLGDTRVVGGARDAAAGAGRSGTEADPRLAFEHLRMLAAGTGAAVAGSLAVTLMIAGLLWHQVPDAVLAAWLGYQLVVAAGRLLHLRHFRRQPPTTPSALGFYVGVVAAALGWGAMAAFVPMLDAPELRTLIVVATAGVTAGGASTYAVLLPAARLFLVIAVLPVAMPFLLAPGRVDLILGMMLVCYLLVMWRNAGAMHAGFAQNVRLRFEHADVAEALRRAQGEGAALNQNLRSKLAQLEATQEELVRAKNAAESAAAAKAEFLANMSHEIRTPMNGVLGMTELILGTPLSKRQTQLAETIHRSGRQLLSVINDILDFSKIEAGKLEISQQAFDLRELIEDVGAIFAENAHRAGIEVVCHVPPGIDPYRLGDVDRLRQVLTNLVSNAVKFTEHGEVVVSVDEVTDAGGAPLLRFAVQDSGIGIAAEHQGRIFDSFTQADGSTTRRFGGTGLGLAICRQL